MDAAHEIHKKASRFGLDAQQFQLVANAAKELGIPLEQSARAMHFLTVNAEAGLNANSKQAEAMRTLGLEAKNFASVNPAERVLLLSDAYSKSAQDAAAYAAAV